MMSMSGGWFFVVASEAISVGQTTITLPGIGSYIALAIEKRDLSAILWAIFAMAIVILIFDQLLFRPLVAWADRFRAEQQTGVEPPRSWVLDVLRRSWVVALATGRSGTMPTGRPPTSGRRKRRGGCPNFRASSCRRGQAISCGRSCCVPPLRGRSGTWCRICGPDWS